MRETQDRPDDEYTAADYAELAETARLVETVDLDALTFDQGLRVLEQARHAA